MAPDGCPAVLEVSARSGAPRTGVWTFAGRHVETPNVLFAVTGRHPAPPFADLLLSASPLEDERPTFVDRGSIYRPLAAEVPLAIHADSAKPSVLPHRER